MSLVHAVTHRVQRSVFRARKHAQAPISTDAQGGRALAERLGFYAAPSEMVADFKRQTEGAPVVRRVARPVG